MGHFAEVESYPVVVKPVESAAADGFKLCHSMEEAMERLTRILCFSHSALVCVLKLIYNNGTG